MRDAGKRNFITSLFHFVKFYFSKTELAIGLGIPLQHLTFEAFYTFLLRLIFLHKDSVSKETHDFPSITNYFI